MALYGGPRAVTAEPPSWPLADDQVRDALSEAYASGAWGRYHGPYCTRLAGGLADYHGVEHVTLCCSGTLAVELALRAVGVAAGDEVILAGYDFAGNFRAVEAIGARPVLVDVAPRNWSLDPDALAEATSESTKAILVSHLHGGIVPMSRVVEMARASGLSVVEDACQAPGALVEGRKAGTWGDVGVLSFGGSKLLTAGRGGAMLTRQAELHQRAKVFADRGNQAFPLSELQAAVLLPQLAKLDQHNAVRQANAARLLERTAGLPGLEPLANTAGDSLPSYYKLGWLLAAEQLEECSIETFIAAAVAEGVPLDTGFLGFAGRSERRCRKVGPLPNCLRAAADTVILHHPILLEPNQTIDQLAVALKKVSTAFSS